MLEGQSNWFDMIKYAKERKNIYAIEMRKNAHQWFYVNVSVDTEEMSTILWTPRMKAAHFFTTEESVEEFKAEYISPRRVSIIRMPSLEVLLTLN